MAEAKPPKLDPNKLCLYCPYRNNYAPKGRPRVIGRLMKGLSVIQHWLLLKLASKGVDSRDFCGYCGCDIQLMVRLGKPCPLLYGAAPTVRSEDEARRDHATKENNKILA